MKAQALITYDPDNKDFWERYQILSHMVDLLKLRGETVGDGRNLRLILTMDDGRPTLFLQGEELNRLFCTLGALRSSMSDDETTFVDELLNRVS